jgi:hypothetical protein
VTCLAGGRVSTAIADFVIGSLEEDEAGEGLFGETNVYSIYIITPTYCAWAAELARVRVYRGTVRRSS